MLNVGLYNQLCALTDSKNILVVVVSKKHSVDTITTLYNLNQRHFGESYVQELKFKHHSLPKDIVWHFVGHLQRNKVKDIAHFVSYIHSVDSLKLLDEIQNQAYLNQRNIKVLIQVKIAQESTKFGLELCMVNDFFESLDLNNYPNVDIVGFMGMASFVDDAGLITKEFKSLKICFDNIKSSYFRDVAKFKELSMGMSGDYIIAINEGATMLRIGSLILGERITNNKN